MKKLVSMLMIFACFFMCAVPCLAVNADVIFTVKGDQKPEENVVVSVVSSKDSALYTTEFYITYAAADLKFIKDSAVAGEAVAELNPIVTATEVSPGKIKVSYTGTKPLDKSGAICHLEFRAMRSTSAPLFIEIEHAETFDGEHIRSLTALGEGTRVVITEQPIETSLIIVFVAILVVGVVVVVVIAKKKKGRK